MYLDFLLEVFRANAAAEAIIWKDRSYSYAWLVDRFSHWRGEIETEGIQSGAVVILEADFSPNSIALFLALADRGCICVPLTESVRAKRAEFIAIAQGEVHFSLDRNDAVSVKRLSQPASHDLYQLLREARHPGLVLFSSGSTGESKAALHDLVKLLEKFKHRRPALRTISFLLYDHIGGINTMFHTLANAGCLVTLNERSPDDVLSTVEKHRVELLPASPTFLNLVLLSEAYKRHDLSSLKTITYGTEPMPAPTLERWHALFPEIKLQQTYGLSEIGILRSKSKSSDSLWVKLGGEGLQTRVVAGLLQVKAVSAMLGYLNAPSPFTEDGWFVTGDAVELEGEYLKILGRRSELIIVGGEKVYPAEVESVIQELDSVAEATVYGEKNLITTNIVCADVTPAHDLLDEQAKDLVNEIKRHCRGRLQRYKVPVKVSIISERRPTARFKKARQ